MRPATCPECGQPITLKPAGFNPEPFWVHTDTNAEECDQ